MTKTRPIWRCAVGEQLGQRRASAEAPENAQVLLRSISLNVPNIVAGQGQS